MFILDSLHFGETSNLIQFTFQYFSKAEESCTYLTDNFRSRCVQVYNYHRLLSWDSTRGLHIDIFKVRRYFMSLTCLAATKMLDLLSQI